MKDSRVPKNSCKTWDAYFDTTKGLGKTVLEYEKYSNYMTKSTMKDIYESYNEYKRNEEF